MVFEGRSESGSPSQEHERQAQLTRQLTVLLAQRVPVERIADILGARRFLTQQRGVTTLNVAGFIASRSPDRQPYRLPERIEPAGLVILPPGHREISRGDGEEWQEADHIDRTAHFIEVLSELDLPYSIQDGAVTETMIRQEPYVAFILPTIRKLAFVCNESGNATYVVHDVESMAEWREYARKHKLEELRPDPKVTWIAWNPDVEAWKAVIALALTEEHAVAATDLEQLEEIPPLDEELGEPPTAETLPPSEKEVEWVSTGEIQRRTGVNLRTVYREFELQKQSDPTTVREGGSAKYRKRWVKRAQAEETIQRLDERLVNVPFPPSEDWQNLDAFWRRLDGDGIHVSREYLAKLCTELAQHVEEPFGQFRNVHDHGKVNEFLKPELIELVEEAIRTVPLPPPGMKLANEIAAELGLPLTTVDRRVKLITAERPELAGQYKARHTYELVTYYKDAIVELVWAAVRWDRVGKGRPSRPTEEPSHPDTPRPAGWLTRRELRTAAGVRAHSTELDELIDAWRERQPAWVLDGWFKGYPTEYFDPALAEQLRAERLEWVHPPEIRDRADISPKIVRRELDQLKDIDPGSVLERRTAKHLYRRVRREAAETIIAAWQRYQEPPTDTRTISDLVRDLAGEGIEVSDTSLKNLRDRFGKDDTEPTARYRHRAAPGGTAEFLHGPLVGRIVEYLKALPEAPDHFVSIAELADQLGLREPAVYQQVRAIIQHHPELGGEYKSRERYQLKLYCDPAIAELIRESDRG